MTIQPQNLQQNWKKYTIIEELPWRLPGLRIINWIKIMETTYEGDTHGNEEKEEVMFLLLSIKKNNNNN